MEENYFGTYKMKLDLAKIVQNSTRPKSFWHWNTYTNITSSTEILNQKTSCLTLLVISHFAILVYVKRILLQVKQQIHSVVPRNILLQKFWPNADMVNLSTGGVWEFCFMR